MCGIVGYVGPREALPLLMGGLRRLEYRGYDSAGVAVQQNGKLEVLRAEGKLDNLAAIVLSHPSTGHTGIGHTRWSAHGRPTEHHAHPHVDCTSATAVIHNGIIENFQELKAPLVAAGHRFASETDTEVVVHLLEDELKTGKSLEDAALTVLPRLEGAAALVFISTTHAGTIVAARISNAGGVIVGHGKAENFVASDMTALLEHTRDMSFLEPGDLAVVTQKGVRFRRIQDGAAIDRPPKKIELDPVGAAKSGYKHFMAKEIAEQPRATADTLAAMNASKERGARLLTFCNVMGSEATRISDDVIYLHTGPEISVASTKAYTAMLVDLFLFAVYLAQRRGTIVPDLSAKLLAEAFHLPTLIDAVLREDGKIRALAYRYTTAANFLHLGRGVNYPTALEGALKLKELSYIHAEGTAAGEMKHGTNALIDKTLPVVAIALQDGVYKKMLSNIQEVRARAGIVIALATDGDEEITRHADEVVRIPAVHELLSPVLAVVPLQLLAYHIADKRGNDVDQPRNLAKAVTVE